MASDSERRSSAPAPVTGSEKLASTDEAAAGGSGEAAAGGSGEVAAGGAAPGGGVVSDGALKTMLRLAVRPDGVHRLLHWVAQQIGGHAMLADRIGRPVYGAPELPVDLLGPVMPHVRKAAAGDVRAAAVDLAGWSVCILSLYEQEPQGVLVLARDTPISAAERNLATEVARLLWLRSRVSEADSRKQRLDAAEVHSREAVLHLLMVGHVSGARRTAAALGPSLPDVLRVYIVECPEGLREEGARRCEEVSRGRAWIVRCPVYSRHLIVLAPTDAVPRARRSGGASADGPADQMETALCSLASEWDGFYVGFGSTVGLRDVASGYRHAFHALAVAKSTTERYARFTRQSGLPALFGPAGRGWAARVLRPLLEYRPHRRQDPDASELMITLTSWLAFHGGAARQLKVHRNTLAGRLRRIEELLGCDLGNLATQARAHLALQLLDQAPVPGSDDPEPTLESLLDTPEVRAWAKLRLSPLREDRVALATLREWLAADARVDLAASRLGISSQGVRKRLARAEKLIKRSLVNGPSARYEMWFALGALRGTSDRGPAEAEPSGETVSVSAPPGS